MSLLAFVFRLRFILFRVWGAGAGNGAADDKGDEEAEALMAT